MALHRNEVQKAFNLFTNICSNLKFFEVQQRDEKNQYDENLMIGQGHKQDDGWESVFVNIRDITPEQMKIWEEGKVRIRNSSFTHEGTHPGITRLGFF
jgi:hypothetical protein